MDDKIKMMQAELEWLTEEIKEHQEYEADLRDEIAYLKSKLATAEAEVTCLMTMSRV